jgi:hypothetical protein
MTATFFDDEHRSLDHTLADVEYLAERRSFQTAGKRFGELRRAVERHLREEEDVLLPEFMVRTGDPRQLLPDILRQHTEVLESLEGVGSALSCSDYRAFCVELARLAQRLRAHEADEERLLHPAMDALLHSDEEWRSLVQAMRRRGVARQQPQVVEPTHTCPMQKPQS